MIINEQNLIKQSLGITNVFEDSSNLNRNLDGFESQLDEKNQQSHTLLDQQRQLTLQKGCKGKNFFPAK